MPKITPPPVPTEEPAFVYEDDHKKSFDQIASEQYHKDIKAKEEPDEQTDVENKAVEPVIEPKTEEKEATPEKPEAKPEVDVAKVAQEAADKAATQARADFRKELDSIAASEQSVADKKKAQDELMSVWDKEDRLPNDYKEIFNEAARVGQAKARQEWEAKEAARTQAEAQKKHETEASQTAILEENKQRQEMINARLTRELEELYQSKIITRPISGKPETEQEENDFLSFGIALNKERLARGEAQVDSLASLYLNYYKPSLDAKGAKATQPAGGNAPVLGAKGAPQADLPEDTFVYARDHKKSLREIAQDQMRRIRS